MSRLTDAERTRYSIEPGFPGWAGRCPVCGELFTANHPAVTQTGVVHAIREHEAEAHAASAPAAGADTPGKPETPAHEALTASPAIVDGAGHGA